MESGEGLLLTVLGPPGVGKTRLVAEVLREQTSLELTWVDLHGVPRGVTSRISACAGSARSGEAALLRVLRGTDVLVLDGIDEGLSELRPLIGRLTERLPHLRIITTSRRTLDHPLEELLFVPGLGRPAADQPLEHLAAGELLLACLARAGRGSLDERETADARRILDRLGGLPLAIELVAAQIADVGASALSATLERPLSWVVRGDQNPLAIALACSAESLSIEARSFLCRAARLERAFDATDAALLAGTGQSLRLLRALRTSSWVVAEETREGAGYDLLPPVRQFVREHLDEEGGPLPAVVAEAILRGLVRGCVTAPEVVQASFAVDLPEDLVLAALRAAFHPFASTGRGDLYAELARDLAARGRIPPEVSALALARGSIDAGRFDEARAALDQAAASRDRSVRDEEQILRARLFFRTGDFERLRRISATLSPTGADDVEVLAVAARIRGDHALGMAIYERALARVDSSLDRAVVRALRARYLVEGGEPTAGLDEADAAQRHAPDDARVIASCETTRALALHDRGEPARALPHYERGTRTYASLGSPLAAYVRGAHAIAALEAGLHEEACATFLAVLEDAPADMAQLGPVLELAQWVVHRAPPDTAEVADSVIATSHALVRAFIARCEERADDDALQRALLANEPHARWSVVSRALSRLARDAPPVTGAEQPGSARALLLDRRASWFAITGTARVSLETRPVLARVLAHLASSAARGAQPATLDDIASAAWPGERMVERAKKSRVHVAISTLRKLGLGAELVHAAVGYQLALPVVWAD